MSVPEFWNPIPEFPGYYISTIGRVWSKKSKKYLKVVEDGCGRPVAFVYSKGKCASVRIDRQILLSFHGPGAEGETACRIREDAGCNLMNLKWGKHRNRRLA